MPGQPYTHRNISAEVPEFNFLVTLDGVPDREDTPYVGARGGLPAALADALALKRAHPNSTVSVQILFES